MKVLLVTKETFQIKFNNEEKKNKNISQNYRERIQYILFEMILLYNQYVGWHFAYN